MKLSFSIIFGLLFFASQAQDDFPLAFWSDVMINANNAQHREQAFEKFYSGLKGELAKGEAFDYDFSKIPELSILQDSAMSFKLISWQIAKQNDRFDYYGFLIKSDGKYYELEDAFENLEDLEFVELNASEWLGGIYYGMHEVGEQYFLFSYRQVDEYNKFKAFDCLTFAADGSPILGSEQFVIPKVDTRDIVKNRITFNYSSDAILSLSYNRDLNMVVHDHLMQVTGRLEGQGLTSVPDGTYEGYQFREGKWVYEEKLFSHTYDEAPRPEQILGTSKKDIFGKEKKNR